MSILNIKKVRRLAIKYLAERDYGYHCCFCERKLNYKTATLDHIVPKSHGGTRSIFNLTLACAECNNKRQASDFILTLIKYGRPKKVIEKFKSIMVIYNQIRFFAKCADDVKSSKDPEIIKNRKEILKIYGTVLKPYGLATLLFKTK